MWCLYHNTTPHNDANCRATPAYGPNDNAHFAQVRPPSVPGICSSWDLPVRDESDEKPCISFLAREVHPEAKPAKARVEEERGARPLGPVQTAATEGRRPRPWPFTPRAEPQPVTKPTKARVEEKGPRPFDPVPIAAPERWKTRPWQFTPRTGQAISIGGPVAEETFGMANDEEPVEKALMASSSVAVTSEDSANSNLATLMAPAKSLPGEVREPLSGGASTPLSGRGSTLSGVRANDEEPIEKALMASPSIAITSEDNAKSNLTILMAPADSLPGEVREPLSGGGSTPLSRGASPPLSGGASMPSGARASPETARPSPAPVPATVRTGAAIRNNRIHRPNVVTRRAAAELTGAVTRYRGVHPNKNSNDDNSSINGNNHAALAECFQPSTLHKLQQLGLSTNTGTLDDNNISNNNHAALAGCFQPNTLHKQRQPGRYTNTVTLDDNINNNNHAALAEPFQPSTLHKLRQLGRYTNTDTPDTAHQLDAEAVSAEVAYMRTNTQPSCSGEGE